MGRHQLSQKSIDRDAPLETFRSYMNLSFPKRPFKTNRSISRTSRASTRKTEQCISGIGRQITPAPVLLLEFKHTVLALRVITSQSWGQSHLPSPVLFSGSTECATSGKPSTWSPLGRLVKQALREGKATKHTHVRKPWFVHVCAN